MEPPSGPTPEAVPVNPASGTARPSSRTWIGWLLALLVIVGAAGATYAVYGLTPLFITTTVPLMVVGFGIGLLLLVPSAPWGDAGGGWRSSGPVVRPSSRRGPAISSSCAGWITS